MRKNSFILIWIIALCVSVLAIIWEFWLESHLEVLIGGDVRQATIHTLIAVSVTLFISSVVFTAGNRPWNTKDITESRKAEEELKLYEKVFESAVEGIVVTDADANIQSVNPAFTAITGYSAEEAIGKNPNILRSDRHTTAFFENMWAKLLTEGCWDGEIWNRRKDGEAYPEWQTISAIKDANGNVEHYVAIFHDITKIKKSEEEIKHLAYYDALTGLPNRLLFKDRLETAIAMARRHKTDIALLFIDLDDFKKINDSLGHTVGDLFLQGVALRLLETLRDDDTVVRLGGDEFTVILQEINQKSDAANVAQKIIMSLEEPFMLKGHDVYVTASIGITFFPRDGDDVDTLVKNADTAMYRAKKNGKNIYSMFEPEMSGKAGRRLTLESEIRKALAREEFVVYYQPKLDINSGMVVGTEALVRWLHPKKGMVPPGDFIPIAEETGLIVPLGEWVLETACRQNVAWQNEGYPPISVAVNLSSMQFARTDIVSTIKSVLDRTTLDPRLLDIEITESMLMGDMDSTIKTLRKLSEMGVRISVDDFGTGYSSLNYLRRFDIDTLKIDGSFVCDITTDANAAAIVSAIISLGRILEMKTVAEGVETAEQLKFLKEHKCEEMQGYLFSPPLPSASLEEILQKGACLSSVVEIR